MMSPNINPPCPGCNFLWDGVHADVRLGSGRRTERFHRLCALCGFPTDDSTRGSRQYFSTLLHAAERSGRPAQNSSEAADPQMPAADARPQNKRRFQGFVSYWINTDRLLNREYEVVEWPDRDSLDHGQASTDPTRAVAYLRVSTEEQNLGPEAQRAAIELWAARCGVNRLELARGSWRERRSSARQSAGAPSCHRCGSRGKAGLLVVAKRDRLARDVMLAAMTEQLLARQGARVVSTAGEGTEGGSDEPAAQLMRTLVDAFAQYERALIRSRTKAALSVKKARGQRVGGVPYGTQLAADGVTLEANVAEQAVIARIQALRGAGASLRAIVAECERVGIVARSGKPLAQTQVVSRKR